MAMKKIIMLVLMLLAFSGICAAFEQPDPVRWSEIARDATNENTFWLDTETVKFAEKNGDSCANFWVMSRKSEEETYVLINFEMDLTKKEYRTLAEERHGANGKVKTKKPKQSPDELIPKGSILELIYERILEIRKG